ncbi:putative Heat shock protein 70 family [Medicago truncatula]|uniref:Putative Heat shock protein 70 family n=1 Tax=Medicago truncatula TaxID=3880 RepID=A0A396GUX6_MEDTR|nr:putative Heat shock protein 70 family [Medicago truncatula]
MFFTFRMLNYFVEDFKRKNNVDITRNPRSLRRLKTACEKAKRMLSFKLVTTIEIDYLCEGIDFSSSITRVKFEEINMDLFNECIKTVESCFNDSKIEKSSVDDIVLVGGSSRIPKVQELLSDFFDGKDLCKNINPDEAVASGAAVQAALLGTTDFKNVPNLALRDVTPLSLGILVKGDIMSVVIPRNTSVPVKTTQRLSFMRVCFTIDDNGILTVSAKEKSTGNTNEITITNDKERLSADEIKKLIQEAEEYRAEDEKFLRKAKVMNELDDCIYKLRNALKNKDVALKLSSQKVENINNAITVATNLLDRNNQQSEVEVLEDHLKELKSMLEDLVFKTKLVSFFSN